MFWAYAAAFGALWGSLEITLGSFLKALQLPLGGVFMGGICILILVAEHQIMPRRGLILATGFVAAICKSVSPGGIIIGIMAGARTVEIFMLFMPRRLFPAIAAGVFVALWPLLQKIVTQWILYGTAIIDLYLALIQRAEKWLGSSSELGWWTLAVFLAAVASFGALCGAMGWRIGRDAKAQMGSAEWKAESQ